MSEAGSGFCGSAWRAWDEKIDVSLICDSASRDSALRRASIRFATTRSQHKLLLPPKQPIPSIVHLSFRGPNDGCTPPVRCRSARRSGPLQLLDGFTDFPGVELSPSTAPLKASPQVAPDPKARSHLSTGAPRRQASAAQPTTNSDLQSPVLVAGFACRLEQR